MTTLTQDAIADSLTPYVRAFTGSTGAGQWAFQLLCSRCYFEGRGSTPKSRTVVKGWKTSNPA